MEEFQTKIPRWWWLLGSVFKGIVHVVSSNSPFVKGHVWFTGVPCTTWLDQKWLIYSCFPDSMLIILHYSSLKDWFPKFCGKIVQGKKVPNRDLAQTWHFEFQVWAKWSKLSFLTFFIFQFKPRRKKLSANFNLEKLILHLFHKKFRY